MTHITIGVAGHVDHGKTALTRALTGVDTDRLAEEKRRGLTIEPGFAPLPLPDGGTAELVDVPGHEKFIHNMLSASSGLDAVLLTVAADDGPMPQTREHLQICSLLGVQRGLVAITKCDLVDSARFMEVRSEIAALTAGTFLEDAPVLPVSVRTLVGLSALKAAIEALAAHMDAHDTCAPFRLNIDRVFSVDGFGTVATGTVADGAVSVGDEVQIYPCGKTARVRGLQSHGQAAQRLEAGSRAALNLAGVDRSEVRRGDALAAPGSLELTVCAEGELSLLPDAPAPLRTGAQLRLYHGAREVLCRCALRGQKLLHPGESCPVKLRFPEPLALRTGDRFVVRALSPQHTIGGGAFTLAQQTTVSLPDPADLLRAHHETYPLRDGMDLAELAQKSGLDAARLQASFRVRGTAVSLPGFRPKYTDALAKVRDQLEVYYRRAKLEPEENCVVDARFDPEVSAKLVRDKVLLPLSPQYRVHRVYEQRAWDIFRSLDTPVALARFRDALGISRKYALLLLEYWDRTGRTRKVGDGRVPIDSEAPR